MTTEELFEEFRNGIANTTNHVLDTFNSNEKDETDEDPTTMKIISMIVLFSSSQLLGLLPFPLAKCLNLTSPKNSNILSTLLSFGAGVLICTTFLHLLPEVSENVSNLQSRGLIANYPFHLAELLMCVGFFFVALVDQIVHCYLHRYMRQHSENEQSIGPAVVRNRGGVGHGSIADLIENDVENQKREHDDEHERQLTVRGVIRASAPSLQHNTSQNSINLPCNRTVENSPDLPYHHHTLPANASFGGILMVLALSVHELFEGLAVGLENSSSNVFIMFISVFFHKVVISFCVGVERIVAKSGFCSMFLYVFSFAFASPLGIFFGIIISNSSSSADSVSSSEVLSVFLQGNQYSYIN
jgi:solute carrier family 39 (zinc transporter), member 1/2/3